MDRESIDKLCERTILWLVLAVLVFGPLATGAVRPVEFLVIQALTACVGIVWIIRIWANARYALLWPPICWAVLAFAGYAVGLYCVADVEYAARKELIRVIVYAFLFLAILNNLHRQETVQVITVTLIFLAMAISAYAIYQFATNSPKVWHFDKPISYVHRGSGTYINPNTLAGFLEMILPLALACTLFGRFSHAMKILFAYGCLVMLVGIGVTVSRGGWIAATAAMVVFFALLIRKPAYRWASVGMLVLLLIVGGVFASKSMAFQRRFSLLNQEGGFGQRGHFWETALEMWKDHPWLGVGPGHYDFRFQQYRTDQWWAQVRPIHTHNDYLNTLADWGSLGMLIIVVALVLLAIGVFRTWPVLKPNANDLGNRQSNRSAFVFGASIGLLAILLHSVVDFNMQIPANAILAITLMALISSHLRFATDRFWLRPGVAIKLLLSMLLLAGVTALVFEGIRKAKEQVWLRQAAFTKEERPKLDALKKAAAVEPQNYETTYKIGEVLRLQSWRGEDNYEALAKEAMTWFERGMKLNPWDPYNFLRYGMCLDWIGRTNDSLPYYQKALSLDPNGAYITAHQGWHYIQTGDYLEAKKWFERSLQIYDNYQNRNPIAVNYLDLIHRKLAEPVETSGIPSP